MSPIFEQNVRLRRPDLCLCSTIYAIFLQQLAYCFLFRDHGKFDPEFLFLIQIFIIPLCSKPNLALAWIYQSAFCVLLVACIQSCPPSWPSDSQCLELKVYQMFTIGRPTIYWHRLNDDWRAGGSTSRFTVLLWPPKNLLKTHITPAVISSVFH